MKIPNFYMQVTTLLIAAVGIFTSYPLNAVPKRYDYAEETNTALREVRASMDDMRHEVSNHESEIRMFEEKLSNQESTMETLRQQVLDSTQASKEMVRSSTNEMEIKVNSLDIASKGLISDLKQLKNHANDTSALIEKYELRITKLEKIIDIQNRNIASLESALNSIASAFDVKEVSTASIASTTHSASKTYVVKSGDSLEKIARQNGTTIKAIKELNQLSSDKITIGKKLALPE